MPMDLDQPKAFFCTKCNWRTAGIPKDGIPEDRRFCVKCRSPLFRCNHCFSFTSGTINGADVTCDHCNKVVAPTSLIL